jgi:hypothetical protein
MDDYFAHYLVLIGDISQAAALGELPVTFRTADGVTETGVPAVRAASTDDEVDNTGYARPVKIGDRTINLEDIVELRLRAPDKR